MTGILINFLVNGEIDFVVHNQASKLNPLANETVASYTIEDIKIGAGSRYAPSSPLMNLEDYLATGKKFAFVGKPCDVAALRAIERSDPRVQKQVPYMISFFCAGVPSLKAAEKVVNGMGASVTEVKKFRYRGNGWPGYATATLFDESLRNMSYFESWGKILSHQVQFRCKICADGVGSFADIVCGDAWNCDDRGYPLFEEKDGSSLVIGRTEKGRVVLERLIANGIIDSEDLSLDDVSSMQPGQKRRKSVLAARLAAVIMFRLPYPVYKGVKLLAGMSGASVVDLLRNFLGMTKRLFIRKYF